MNKLKFNLMESLVKVKDQTDLEKSILNIGKELIEEGFDKMDIREFILLSVHKYLASAE